jgi:class 3 adenylate cyclase/tetratricopeptide (TPR) repeat protein
MRCQNCGRENPEGFRFCGHCSAALEPPAEAREEVRKTVTVLFSDVSGSTRLGERLDPETVRRVMGRYFDEMKAVLESHGGTVEKFIGDAVMAVFGVPSVHEDDALRAVRAATEMRGRLGRLNEAFERDYGVSIAARTGVNTGEVVAGTAAQTLATGDAVNVAARLEQLAEPGEILIGADTHRLVRDAVDAEPMDPLRAKGKSEPVRAFRLISVGGAEGLSRRFDLPMVGRRDELRSLSEALGRSKRERICTLVTILGAAGVGKSRLVQAFLNAELESVSILRGRCLPYGEGITYWPVVEMLTSVAQVGETDGPDEVRAKIVDRLEAAADAELIAERLAQLLGVSGAEAVPEETHWAVRRLFESLAASQPLIVVVEDLHWAEPSLLDLIEHVAYRSRDVPIVLASTARPELLERRPDWAGGQLRSTSLELEPLSDVECDELIGNLLHRSALPAQARRSIAEASEGNPLFVEHLVAMLIDDGRLRRVGDEWTVEGDLSDLMIPPSITALLEARLERLTAEERAAIERGSIEGSIFHLGSVRSLSPEGASVIGPLMSLVRRDMIRADRAAFAGDEAFRFRHVLVRDATYQRIPKETRAALHEGHAAWLTATAGDRLTEFEEIVGFHLEQAYRLRAELGPPDALAAELARRAAEHLIASGRRAADRGDARAAGNLLSRGLELLPVEFPDRARLLTDLSVLLMNAGEIDRARAAAEDAESTLEPSPDVSLEIGVQFARLTLDAAMDPEGVPDRMKREGERAIPRLEAIGDDAGLARAWSLIGEAELFGAHNGAVLIAFRRALEHADRAGDRTAASHAATWCLIATYGGPTPLGEGLRSIDVIAARAPNNREVRAWTQIARGRLLALLGRVDEGRRLVRAGRATFEDLGLTLTLGGSSMEAAGLEEIAGDIEAAERLLRSGYELLASLGEKGYLSTAAGQLARCMALLGRIEEAEELAGVSEDAAATDDVYSQIVWRQARALALARRGRSDEALALAQDIVALAEPSDDCRLVSMACEDVAEVYRLADRTGEAAAALERAIDVWDRKAAPFVADRLRARLAELTAP